MSLRARVEQIERSKGGRGPAGFWMVGHREDGLVHGPAGERLTVQEYERLVLST